MNFCKCGCGKEVSLAKRTDPRYGTIKGQPLSFLLGHKNTLRKLPEDEAKRRIKASCKAWREANKEELRQKHIEKRSNPEFVTELRIRSRKQRENRMASNPELERRKDRTNRLKKHGWTNESYASAKEAQSGRCAICGVTPEPFIATNRWNPT